MNREQAAATVTALFECWYSFLVRYASHSCGSVELAEEFTQEAFIALYRNLREGVTIENPRAWLMQTVKNQVCNHWRTQRRRPEELMSAADLEALIVPELPTQEGEPASLADFLSLLSEREQEVVLMRAKGFKYKQIAADLGITTNSVGTMILRAIRKIRSARERWASGADREKVYR